MSVNADVRRAAKRNAAVALAVDAAWTIRRGGRGHLILDCPYGCCCRVVVSLSPSDWRGEKNAASIIKKCQRTRKGA